MGCKQVFVGPGGDEIDVAEATKVLDEHGLKMRIGRRFDPGVFRVDETFVRLYRVDPSDKEYVEDEEVCAPRDLIKVMSEVLERVRYGQYDLPK